MLWWININMRCIEIDNKFDLGEFNEGLTLT